MVRNASGTSTAQVESPALRDVRAVNEDWLPRPQLPFCLLPAALLFLGVVDWDDDPAATSSCPGGSQRGVL